MAGVHRWLLRLWVLMLLGSSSSGHAEMLKQILVVSQASDGPNKEVIDGFKQQLSNVLQAEYQELTVTAIKADPESLKTLLNTRSPELLFVLGVEALEIAKQSHMAVPIVATLILKADRLRDGATGVSLSYPLDVQLQWLKKFFPDQSRIAVMFNPDENSGTIQQLNKLAARYQLELLAIPVPSAKHLPDALGQLSKNVEVILTIPDEVAVSSKTAKEVLLASFRNRVPLIGLSDNWVKSGALYALTWDYADLGRQCAAQAIKLLDGQVVAQVAPETPRKLTYAINSKIAEHMNIQLPENLYKNARELFQ